MPDQDSLLNLVEHLIWADAEIAGALQQAGADAPAEAVREFAHVVGSEETWLARLQDRPPRIAVWPDLALPEITALVGTVASDYRSYVTGLNQDGLGRSVSYTNTAGRHFKSSVVDILMHVFLHAQYHRGKVNLLLRQAGHEPCPVDHIAFTRGARAHSTRTSP